MQMRGTCLSSAAAGCRSDRAGLSGPFSVSTLIYAPLANRVGIRRVMFASLAAFSILSIRNVPQHQKLMLFSRRNRCERRGSAAPSPDAVPDPICGVLP